MKLPFIKPIAIAAIAAIAVIGPAKLAAEEGKSDDSRLEQAMGTFLGNAMNRSIDQISGMGVKFDRRKLIGVVLDVLDGKDTGMTFQEADEYIGRYIDSLRSEASKPLSEESQAEFVAAAAAEEGAMRLPSGLVFKVIVEGEGAMPDDDNSVRLLYTGSLSNGEVFDSTEDPVVFTVKNLVPGFTEGLKLMRPGGTYEITFPASLGYGPDGIPGAIPGNAALKFKVNLIDVI